MAHFHKPECKCPKDKRCNCKATWYYTTYIGFDPSTGKRKQKKQGGFRTRQEAIIAEALLQSEIENETYVDEKNITFEDFAQQWKGIYASKGNIKVSTLRVRDHEIARLNKHFAKLRIKDINRQRYQDMLNKLEGADSTRDGIHGTGRMIFRKAVEMEVIKTDPTQYGLVPKKYKSIEELEAVELPKYLEKDELITFLQAAKEYGLERDLEIFTTLAYTGMRAGELCALKVNDVDQTGHTIRITKTYYNPKNNIQRYELLPPKTKSSKRTIDIEPVVLECLNRLISYQKQVKMMHRQTYHDKGFIFAQTENNPGYPVYIKFIENRMERLLKLAGLNTDLTPHSLRHTHCSLLAEAEVSLEQIMQRLGHSDDAITKAVYLHVTKPKKKEASHKFGQLMQGLQ